jgi:hypothetical protein
LLVVGPFPQVEFAGDDDARAVAEALSAQVGVRAVDLDGEVVRPLGPSSPLRRRVPLATRTRATSVPEGSGRSSTSRVRLPVRVAVAMSRMIWFSFVTFGVSGWARSRGAPLEGPPVGWARQRDYDRPLLGPAPAGRRPVGREPTVAALVVSEPAEDAGLDRATPATLGHRGGVAGAERDAAHGGPTR